MGTITLRLFTIGASLHIWKTCNNRGHGERNPHQGCRVSKIHKVGFELLRRNLPLLSRIWNSIFDMAEMTMAIDKCVSISIEEVYELNQEAFGVIDKQ